MTLLLVGKEIENGLQKQKIIFVTLSNQSTSKDILVLDQTIDESNGLISFVGRQTAVPIVPFFCQENTKLTLFLKYETSLHSSG